MWSIDTRDWEIRDAEVIHNIVMDRARNKMIVLAHDMYSATVAAMETLIPALIEEGYQLVTISEMFEFSRYDELVPGRLYRDGR
jgi:peptidoglycan/xylan/chitin deacetylase (PgdA/CDA1 family)